MVRVIFHKETLLLSPDAIEELRNIHMTVSSLFPEKTNAILEKVREDFAFCRDTFFAILIFGSYARGTEESYSDIDVCIVRKKCTNAGTVLYDIIYPHVQMDKYDVVIFEGCSDDIKSDIAENHLVVYSGDEGELNEYLRPYLELRPEQRNPREILGEMRSVVDVI